MKVALEIVIFLINSYIIVILVDNLSTSEFSPGIFRRVFHYSDGFLTMQFGEMGLHSCSVMTNVIRCCIYLNKFM